MQPLWEQPIRELARDAAKGWNMSGSFVTWQESSCVKMLQVTLLSNGFVSLAWAVARSPGWSRRIECDTDLIDLENDAADVKRQLAGD